MSHASLAANSSPACLNGMPAAIIKVLSVQDVFWAALTFDKDPKNYGLIIALEGIESYFMVAKRQHRRIERAEVSIHKSRGKHGRNLFSDVHFYLIAWARIAKLADFIQAKTQFPRVRFALRPYRQILGEFIDARDHLEHFEDRVPGGKKHETLKVRTDLLNMHNHYLTFGGRRIDVGPNSIRLLNLILSRVRQAILFDALDVLANKDPKSLTRILKRAAAQVDVARTTKMVTRLLQKREQQ